MTPKEAKRVLERAQKSVKKALAEVNGVRDVVAERITKHDATKKATEHPWCVKHRDGWCLMKRQPKGEPHEPKSANEATRCGFFVVLPLGYGRREPTCTECKSRMK